MSELRKPLRDSLRDPATHARLDAVWQRVETRVTGRRQNEIGKPLLIAFLIAATAALIVLMPKRATAPGPIASHHLAAPAAVASALTLSDGQAIAELAVANDGAERALTLSDGSRVSLTPGTRVRPLSSTPEALVLEVAEGRARFEVGPQGGRAFRVRADQLEVSVVGTGFSVAIEGDQVHVEVQHGRVRVRGPNVPGGEVLLSAAQTLSVRSARPVEPAAAPAAVPWPKRRP